MTQADKNKIEEFLKEKLNYMINNNKLYQWVNGDIMNEFEMSNIICSESNEYNFNEVIMYMSNWLEELSLELNNDLCEDNCDNLCNINHVAIEAEREMKC